MEYYVYVLLNPLKCEKFKYGKYDFDYEPFYVGKGKGNRITETIYENKNQFKRNIIDKIVDNGLKPISIILYKNLSEEKSFKLEKEIIGLIGRRDLKTGILTNFTDGGEGTSGIIQSKETIEKRKKSLQKYRPYFKSDEFKEKMRKVAAERKNDSNWIKYYNELSEKYKGKGNPMYGKETSLKQKESVRRARSEGRIKLSEKGRNTLIENGRKRKGTKNSKIKKDAKKYELISPSNENFIIFGAVRLQKFCKDNKLQYHVLKNNVGTINSDMTIGNKINAKNTLGWKTKKN